MKKKSLLGLLSSLLMIIVLISFSIAEASQYDGQVKLASWFKTDEPEKKIVIPAFSFADLAEKVQTSVVNISTSQTLKRRAMPSPFGRFGPKDQFDDFFDKFFGGQMPQEQELKSLGSGFIINKNGDIITNYHVVGMADDITVKLSDGRKFKAKVVGGDDTRDIAVIRIDAKGDLPYLEFGNSDNLRPGEWVMAIGNPFGLGHTVTVGVVSAIGRMVGQGPIAKFIQTDCSINPGNSGGPLFNMEGKVIGMNTMIFANAQGIGFAIPSKLIERLIPDLISKGKVSRGWLGVVTQIIDEDLAKSFDMDKPEGVLLSEVVNNSPAAKAGLQRGDIILKVGKEKIDAPQGLAVIIGNTKPDTKLDLEYLRDKKKMTTSVTIGTWNEESETIVAGSNKADKIGLIARTITLEDRDTLDVPANFKGVVVKNVESGSPAMSAGIRSGDVILEINQAKISTIEEYRKVVDQLKEGKIVRIFLKRGRSSIYVAFQL
ncbi:MAG: DegQ family serine endoprotease [Pseudomonadota bacterium]